MKLITLIIGYSILVFTFDIKIFEFEWIMSFISAFMIFNAGMMWNK